MFFWLGLGGEGISIFGRVKGRVQKNKKQKLIEFSIKGWVGVLRRGSFSIKKYIKKNMPLKSILGHFKPF